MPLVVVLPGLCKAGKSAVSRRLSGKIAHQVRDNLIDVFSGIGGQCPVCQEILGVRGQVHRGHEDDVGNQGDEQQSSFGVGDFVFSEVAHEVFTDVNGHDPDVVGLDLFDWDVVVCDAGMVILFQQPVGELERPVVSPCQDGAVDPDEVFI